MSEQRFNPADHLRKVSGGADYLEVKWRVYWLRTEHPDAIIETEMTTMDAQFAVFRARVQIPGGGSATGWGSETQGDFRDFIEKAETKALGRALAVLGYGTQFCDDYDFGGTSDKTVDAPVTRQQSRQPQQRTVTKDPPVDQQAIAGLHARATAVGIDHQQLHDYVVKRFPAISSVKELTGRMMFELNKDLDSGAVAQAMSRNRA